MHWLPALSVLQKPGLLVTRRCAPAACTIFATFASSTSVRLLHARHRPTSSSPRSLPVRSCRMLWTSSSSKTHSLAALSEKEKAAIERRETRQRDWAIIKRLTLNLWPKNEWGIRSRVLVGLGLLFGAKVRADCHLLALHSTTTQILNVQVPFVFRSVIDGMNIEITADTTVWLLAGSLILGCALRVSHPVRAKSRAVQMVLRGSEQRYAANS